MRDLKEQGYGPRLIGAIEKGKRLPRQPAVTVETYAWFIKHAADIHPDAYGVVICDEAHTALGERTAATIRRFSRPTYIGMTATDQLLQKHVGDVFPAEVADFPLADAVRRGVVAPLRALRVKPGASLRNVPVVGGDYDQRALAEALDHEALNMAAAMLYRDRFDHRAGIVYAAGRGSRRARGGGDARHRSARPLGQRPHAAAHAGGDARGLRARRYQRARQRTAAGRGLERPARHHLHAPRADGQPPRLPAAHRTRDAAAPPQGGRRRRRLRRSRRSPLRSHRDAAQPARRRPLQAGVARHAQAAAAATALAPPGSARAARRRVADTGDRRSRQAACGDRRALEDRQCRPPPARRAGVLGRDGCAAGGAGRPPAPGGDARQGRRDHAHPLLRHLRCGVQAPLPAAHRARRSRRAPPRHQHGRPHGAPDRGRADLVERPGAGRQGAAHGNCRGNAAGLAIAAPELDVEAGTRLARDAVPRRHRRQPGHPRPPAHARLLARRGAPRARSPARRLAAPGRAADRRSGAGRRAHARCDRGSHDRAGPRRDRRRRRGARRGLRLEPARAEGRSARQGPPRPQEAQGAPGREGTGARRGQRCGRGGRDLERARRRRRERREEAPPATADGAPARKRRRRRRRRKGPGEGGQAQAGESNGADAAPGAPAPASAPVAEEAPGETSANGAPPEAKPKPSRQRRRRPRAVMDAASIGLPVKAEDA